MMQWGMFLVRLVQPTLVRTWLGLQGKFMMLPFLSVNFENYSTEYSLSQLS